MATIAKSLRLSIRCIRLPLRGWFGLGRGGEVVGAHDVVAQRLQARVVGGVGANAARPAVFGILVGRPDTAVEVPRNLNWAIWTRAPQSRIVGSAIGVGIGAHLILRSVATQQLSFAF